MKILYQNTHVPGCDRAVTLNYIDDAGNSVVMLNTLLSTTRDPVAGTWSATVSQVDGNGTVISDDSGPITGTVGAAANEDAAIMGASGAIQGRVLPLPEIGVVSPPGGPAVGGTAVTIRGTGFGSASAVHFGGVPATSFSVRNVGEIDAISPAGAVGAVPVTITVPGGSAVSEGAFTYV